MARRTRKYRSREEFGVREGQPVEIPGPGFHSEVIRSIRMANLLARLTIVEAKTRDATAVRALRARAENISKMRHVLVWQIDELFHALTEIESKVPRPMKKIRDRSADANAEGTIGEPPDDQASFFWSED